MYLLDIRTGDIAITRWITKWSGGIGWIATHMFLIVITKLLFVPDAGHALLLIIVVF